jgi:hypothetical protein
LVSTHWNLKVSFSSSCYLFQYQLCRYKSLCYLFLDCHDNSFMFIVYFIVCCLMQHIDASLA